MICPCGGNIHRLREAVAYLCTGPESGRVSVKILDMLPASSVMEQAGEWRHVWRKVLLGDLVRDIRTLFIL